MTRKLHEPNARSEQVRFSIKDLLWLTALSGIVVGWYLDHRAAMVRRQSDWDVLSKIDTSLQLHEQALRFFQKDLDELQNGSSIPKEQMKHTGDER